MLPQPRTYRQLQPEDRVTLTSLKQQNYSVREITSVLSCLTVVQHLLRQRWSPEQIALTLARIYPKGHELRVSHETTDKLNGALPSRCA